MGVNAPLHFGGSLRGVAQAARPASASVRVQREMTVSQFLGLREPGDARMEDSSEGHRRTGRDSGDGQAGFTHQLRLIRSGLIVRQTALAARPL